MPRSKNSVPSHRRRRKILNEAKGYRGGKSKLLKTAKEAVDRALTYAYRDRKKRKSDFRKLWITRINAGVREHGVSYSAFMNHMKKKDIQIDRKMLVHIAATDPQTFEKIVKQVEG
ncbi:MAG: 50S ribosomal protein L20 [candidate division KSB1 bacterium]|jgi:large subunit ribosomal protein L20|nr:50S ribosomal protein L20 [candidate division KSB1 bacterium]